MKFMLFTYRDPSVELDPEERAAVPAAVAAWCDEMEARGVRVGGHVLGSAPRRGRFGSSRRDDGEDGPLADQDVPIAGFNILECADADEALEVASKNPGARFGILELRPIEEM